ncbi:GH15 family glucan-1,4-alpha-glucosidase [Motilibacter peucedani]|uniref:Trehalase n=1 Tax=Motilibacter peucedani TaxID=598650 RepID=A0A420XUH7_9ACTN|nr:glycoside hydrolase family 15 protein [Motilibacter peucedani]RKS80484.1 GH15 family glucan-1,4-alpha-glucosidase [Motilibacter peucedani]
MATTDTDGEPAQPDDVTQEATPPASGPSTSAFPPIGDYGFISDGEVTALVAPSGAIEWMSVPRMDAPSVFGAILGRHAGAFGLGPSDRTVPDARRYLPGTMVLETSWGTSTGWLIVRDVLVMGPWHHQHERSGTHKRPPTDYDAEHILLRTVRCASGEVQVVMDCEPVADYGRVPVVWSYTGDDYSQGVARAEGTDLELVLTSDMRLGFEGGLATARTLLKEGEERFVAMSWHGAVPPRTFAEAYDKLVWTAHHWQHWLARGNFPDHPWRSFLQRSALTLKGLTYAPTGAIMAAATTSLPETPQGSRNYDYRYSWIRDSTFALWAMYTLGFDWEAVDFFSFLLDVATSDGEVQIMYGIGGEAELPERELPHLPGYAGASPVRIGNAAYDQVQHDVWGAILDSVYLHAKVQEHIDERIWPLMEALTQRAMDAWREPDRGIWEVRGEPQHFVSSKIMCWVALDRGARIARMLEQTKRAEEWSALADEIRDDVLTHGLDERGVLVQRYGSDALDASVLLAPLLRFLPQDDPRLRATVLAVADELTVDGLVLRYRPEETDDGFHGEEGTFTICSFWLVSALVEIGEVDRARRLCEKLLSLSGDLQLYAEELDPRTGKHLGNFPQAFTHLALVNAVMHVVRAEES